MEEELQNNQQGEQMEQNPFDIDLSELNDVGAMFLQDDDTVVTTPVEDTEETEDTTNEGSEEQEDTDENEETSDKEKKEAPSSKDTKKSSPFTPYAKLVTEEGVLPNFNIDEWDGTPQGLVKAMQDEINNGINSQIERLDPRVRWLAENAREGVPFEELLAIDKQRVTLDSITEETLQQESIQKDIARQYYKETTRFSDDRINKEIERLEATGDLGEETKGFFEELKQINSQKELQLREQARQQQLEQEQQRIKVLEDFKKNVTAIDEIIPGVKVNTVMKDKIYKGLTTPVDTDPQTGMPINKIAKARMADPVKFETTLMYLFEATDGFKDFSVFQSAGKKSAIKEFEDSVANMDFGSSTKQKLRKPDTDQSLVEQMAWFSQQR